MAKKKTKRKKLEPWVTLEDGCAVELRFSDRLEEEPETLRRLAHRTVDLLVDAGHYDWLSGSVAIDLGRLADEIVAERVTELIHEGRAEGKAAPRG